jgi:hypothetical protein
MQKATGALAPAAPVVPASLMIPFLNSNDEKWPHTRQKKLSVEIAFLHCWGIKNTLIMQS